MDALAARRNRTLALASVGAAVGMLGFKDEPFFEAPAEDKQAPTVQF